MGHICSRREPKLNNAKLNELFGGKSRFALLCQLYLNTSRQFTASELATRAGVDGGNAVRWLKKWADLGLVRMTVDGRNITYQASDDSLLSGLTDIMRRSDAILDDIREALPPEVETAVVFGSTARGEERTESDIGVLALGSELHSIQVNSALRPVGRKHNRIVNVSVYSKEEFEQMLRDEDSFALNVMGQNTIPLRGELKDAQRSPRGRATRT